MKFLVLFAEFFKIGLFSVGGGLATLPFLYELAEKYDWFGREKVADFLAVAQSAPGAVGVNMGAQAGFMAAAAGGALLAVLGLITPSIIVIIIVARMFRSFKENKTVAAVFSGLRPAAVGLLTAAGLGVWKLALVDAGAPVWYKMIRPREALIFAAVFVLLRKFRIHPVIYIAAAGALGLALKL
ncbi:MAG: chromate transporter [Treponema sp.]|nr:chromate transporter [Treponema sp.]